MTQDVLVLLGAFFYNDYSKAKERLRELEEEPYFTSEKISAEEMDLIVDCLKFSTAPMWNQQWYVDHWPDYSYYSFELGDKNTAKQIAVLNYILFVSCDGSNEEAKAIAKSYGLSQENPIDDGWILNNNRSTAEILASMDDGGDCLRNQEFVEEIYQIIREKNDEKEK